MPGPEPTPQGPPTPDQVVMVQYCWGLLKDKRREFLNALLLRVTELDPTTQPLLELNGKQMDALVEHFSTLIRVLEDLSMASGLMVESKANPLISRFPEEKHALFGAALIWTLGNFLREEFDDTFQKAWMMAFQWTQSKYATPNKHERLSAAQEADIYAKPPARIAPSA